jgi:hypothetical protein
MKQIRKFQNLLKGLTAAITRFPLTSVFLLAAAAVNAIDISKGNTDYSKYLLTLATGALLGAVAQVVYERFFTKTSGRIALVGAAALLTLGYYLIIMPVPRLSMEIGIRTAVALFALFIAFIWIPSVRSKITFNESFMIAFKAFFIAIFFSGVIFGGISIILAAIDQLLFSINNNSYSHAANIVFVLYAPIYFLALIPVYPGKKDGDKEQENPEKHENISKLAGCPKFLEILISYIIIPLTAVFTVILVIYIILNIGGKFWTDNLLEPMIVSYSIVIILVYILASRLENKFTALFRMVFPKILVPIVIFQTVSSVLRTVDMGITHNRYYVIIYGVFATAAGIILSFMPVRKNGIVAAMLIVFSVISIVPPVDAFTVSRSSQISLLKSTLMKNGMLEDDRIKPNASIPDEDKIKITRALSYLNMMEYTGYISWLPNNFDYYNNFQKTFGFSENVPAENQRYVNVYLPQGTPVNVSGFDYLVSANIFISGQSASDDIGVIEKDGQKYTLKRKASEDQCDLVLVNSKNQELLRFSTKDIFKKFEDYTTEKGLLSVQEATFSKENELAAINIIVQNLNMNKEMGRAYYGADCYVLVRIKGS